VRQMQQTVANAKAAQSFLSDNRNWLKVLERHVSAWAHVEHGIGMHVFTACQRDAPTNMINNAMAVAAAHKLRFAQDLILYNLEVSEQVDSFDGAAHRAVWQEDPVWKGTRENVERLTATRDWAEAYFATTLVFEPLVGELFRSHFVMQTAAPQGDYVTPTLIGAGEADVARDQRGARRLYKMLADDPEHGAENRAVLQKWLDAWAPLSVKAGLDLQPIWSQVSEKVVTFAQSRERAQTRFTELLDELGLSNAKEL
jgi:propane 2-monooxygenase small subunit